MRRKTKSRDQSAAHDGQRTADASIQGVIRTLYPSSILAEMRAVFLQRCRESTNKGGMDSNDKFVGTASPSCGQGVLRVT